MRVLVNKILFIVCVIYFIHLHAANASLIIYQSGLDYQVVHYYFGNSYIRDADRVFFFRILCEPVRMFVANTVKPV